MNCPACGQENPEGFRLCGMCGSPLEAPAPERRKLATMLFCDLSGSTAMGERVDAESVREMMFSYFHEMRGAIERHGGTVEKFIGDAVMAVFGVPRAHEDDALRACRAAFEMQERLATLNEQLERRYGSTIALRIGVNTGEVVAGDATLRQALVTGDAVNVAARLEQAASPGEILIGEPTFRLVRDAVSADPVDPLELKGKSEPLSAYRLTDVDTVAPARARRLDTPIVGREDELVLLHQKLEEAAAGEPALATIVGEPGVGKSRLAAELIADAQVEFRILEGRCLQYGEGITYWPIAEIVRQAAGIRDEHSREEALRRVEALVPGERRCDRRAGRSGWRRVTRRRRRSRRRTGLFQARARPPLLVFVDDIHWAEPALLDLLAGVPPQAGKAPLLLLCLARPELLEGRQWEATVRLQPLEQDDRDRSSSSSSATQRYRPDSPNGSPTQPAATRCSLRSSWGCSSTRACWSGETGAGRPLPASPIPVPPTLRELLGASLDRMPSGERSALERGAVEGQLFHRGAVASCPRRRSARRSPSSSRSRNGVVIPAPAGFADEAAFRFRHILIRDAAYEGMPKKVRADLHERFADWLEESAGERASEYEEILGYHLEQAYRYREELGPPTEADQALAPAPPGGSSAQGGERSTAGTLRRRSISCRGRPTCSRWRVTRLELLLFVGEELGFMMDLDRAESILREVQERAARLATEGSSPTHAFGSRSCGSSPSQTSGSTRCWRRSRRSSRCWPNRGRAWDCADARRARVRVLAHGPLCRLQRRSREGDRALPADRRPALGSGAVLVPRLGGGVRAGARGGRHRTVPAHPRGGGRRSHGRRAHAVLARETGGETRALRRRARARGRGAGDLRGHRHDVRHLVPLCRGEIELLAGDEKAAERDLRRSIDPLVAISDFPSATNAASLLAGVLVDQEQLGEAGDLVAHAEEWAPKDQPIQHARVRAARARLLARQGQADAEAVAREAVGLADTTDFLELRGDCRVALADVLRRAGHEDGAAEALGEALRLYERKGNVVSAERVRALLAPLSPAQ